MDTQYTALLLGTGLDYLETDGEEERTYLGTMQAFDTIELDEEELTLAREAAKTRVNRTLVHPNLYSYDWSDAHTTFWDRVKERLATRLDAWGATVDKAPKAVSVAGGGGIRATSGTITLVIPMHQDEFEIDVFIETTNPTKLHKRTWRHNLGYALLQPGTAIGTKAEEIHLLLVNLKIHDK